MSARTAEIYLNAGWAGPSERRTIAAVTRALSEEAFVGPTSLAGLAMTARETAACRLRLAEVVNAPSDRVHITSGSRSGIVDVLGSLTVHSGDEILVTSLEHPGVVSACQDAASRNGALLQVVDIAPNDSDPDIIERLSVAMSERTRLLVFSHVAYGSGLTFPAQAIVAEARRNGVAVLIDGAQSVGHIPVDVTSIGCHFYVLSGQKWLCGPTGTGALFVSADAAEFLPISATTALEPPWVQRYKQVNVGLVAGLATATQSALEFGVGAAAAVSLRLRELFCAALAGADVFMLGRAFEQNGIVSIAPRKGHYAALKTVLDARGIVTRTITKLSCIRLCFASFNTESDALSAAQAITDGSRRI